MKIAHYCMDNSAHIFSGENLDGIRCPYCEGLVNIKPVSNEEYGTLPKYRELKKKYKPKNKSVKQTLASMGIDLDTDVFQRKLRAISRHTEALADELEYIDKAKCEECGGLMDVAELICDDVVIESLRECSHCNRKE